MISADIKLLERAFNVFNRVYFEGKLPKVAITIQSAKCYAYITTSKVWTDSQDRYFEINLSAEYLNRNIENVLSSLLHECVHLWNMIHGRKDTSNGNRYHNQVFRKEAEERDLIISYDKSIGWSITTPSERLIQVIKDNGLYENIDHARITKDTQENTIRKKSSTRKYICTCCSTNIRATKNVNIICADCMALMVKVE